MTQLTDAMNMSPTQTNACRISIINVIVAQGERGVGWEGRKLRKCHHLHTHLTPRSPAPVTSSDLRARALRVWVYVIQITCIIIIAILLELNRPQRAVKQEAKRRSRQIQCVWRREGARGRMCGCGRGKDWKPSSRCTSARETEGRGLWGEWRSGRNRLSVCQRKTVRPVSALPALNPFMAHHFVD